MGGRGLVPWGTTMAFKKLRLLMTLLFISSMSFAQQPKKNPDAVIDFEADLIQGESQRPDLMTQFGDRPMEIDSILYLRRDFNDLHQGDASRRPSFFPAPKVLGGAK
jgi:hypothetical protein